MDMVKLRKNLAMLAGDPPYNKPSNICWHDAYFAKAIEREFGKPIEELKKLVRDSR